MAYDQKSIFEELAPFAKMIVVPGVTVGQLQYVNATDLFSTGTFASSGAGVVGANTEVKLFNAALGDQAANQGYTGGTMTLSQTNSKFSKGQAPANQAFIAISAGFQITKISTQDLSGAAPVVSLLGTEVGQLAGSVSGQSDLYSVAQSFSWDLTVGRGITRTIGTLSEYCSPGTFAATSDDVADGAISNDASSQLGTPYTCLKRLEVPLIFPPLVNVSIEAKNGSPFQLINAATTNVQIRMILRGFLMTMPVA